MIWKTLVDLLLKDGMTQREIASAVGCSQTTVSEIALEKTTDPRCSTGFGLLRLAKSRGIQVQFQDDDVAAGSEVVAPAPQQADPGTDRRRRIRRREDQVQLPANIVQAALAVPDKRQIGRFGGGRRDPGSPGRRASDLQLLDMDAGAAE